LVYAVYNNNIMVYFPPLLRIYYISITDCVSGATAVNSFVVNDANPNNSGTQQYSNRSWT